MSRLERIAVYALISSVFIASFAAMVESHAAAKVKAQEKRFSVSQLAIVYGGKQ